MVYLYQTKSKRFVCVDQSKGTFTLTKDISSAEFWKFEVSAKSWGKSIHKKYPTAKLVTATMVLTLNK